MGSDSLNKKCSDSTRGNSFKLEWIIYSEGGGALAHDAQRSYEYTSPLGGVQGRDVWGLGNLIQWEVSLPRLGRAEIRWSLSSLPNQIILSVFDSLNLREKIKFILIKGKNKY